MRAAAAARLNDAKEEEQRDRAICEEKRWDRGGGEAKGGVNEDRGTCAEEKMGVNGMRTEKWHGTWRVKKANRQTKTKKLAAIRNARCRVIGAE
jgi:hypothetical protein